MSNLSFLLFFFIIISFCHCHCYAQTVTESPTSEPTSNTTIIAPSEATSTSTPTPTPTITINTTMAPTPTSTSTPTKQTTTSTPPPSNVTTLPPTSIPSSTQTTTAPPYIPTISPTMCDQQQTCDTCTRGCYWCTETETCYSQNSTYICADIGWKSTPQQCLLPQWNPFLTQEVSIGNLNASNLVWSMSIPGVDAIGNFVYFQVEPLTPNAPRLTMTLLLRMPDGSMRSWPSRVSSQGLSYITIRPSLTGGACLSASRGRDTCTFILQVQAPNYHFNTNNIEFRMSASGGPMLDVDVQLSTYTNNGTVVLFGLELYPAALDVKITLRPTAFNSKTDLDLYIAHESWVKQYQYPDHQVGRGSNQEESFIIGQNLYQSGLFIIAVAPAQMDATRKYFDLIIVRNFKNEFIFGLSTLGIIAAIAILILCIFSAVAIIAKRRRRLFLSMQASQLIGGGGGVAQGPPVPTGATPEEMELIPIHPYKKEIVKEDDALCSICLAAYEPSQTLRTLPCHHHFHQSCIDPWLSQHRTCPNCRQSAIPDKAQATSLAAAVANGLRHSQSQRSPSAAEPVPLVMNDDPRHVEPVTVSPSHSHSISSHHRVNVGTSPMTDIGHSAVTVSIHSSNPSTPDNDASLSRSVRRLSHPRDIHMDDSKQDSHS